MNDEEVTQGTVIEGEVEETVEESTPAAGGDAVVLINLESLIKGHVGSIEKLSKEAREEKETLDSILNNEPTYKEHFELAKEANRVKSETKQQILKRPDVKHVAEKLKSLKSEAGELEDELTEYLREYQRMSGNTEIEGDNGEMLKIVTVAKLVRSSAAPK